MSSVLVQTIIDDALIEIQQKSPTDGTDANVSAFVRGKLVRLLDNWNAQREAVWASNFLDFTLTPALQPHTIGPSASSPTWTVTTSRPVTVDGIDLVLNTSTPNIYIPLNMRDDAWFMRLPTPDLSTSIPTDVYYSADFPLGAFYFWPVPSTAYGIRLNVRIVLADVTAGSTLTMPPGYRDALTLTLAEESAPGLELPVDARTSASAQRARARIFANNDTTPTLATQDAGMPGGPSSNAGMFNYRSGFPFGGGR